MPTTILRSAPWWASVCITMLASQPTNAPKSNHRMKLIIRLTSFINIAQLAFEHNTRMVRLPAPHFEKCARGTPPSDDLCHQPVAPSSLLRLTGCPHDLITSGAAGYEFVRMRDYAALT